MKNVLLLVCGLLLAGCSITQNVKPVGEIQNKEVCIIENPDTREGFLNEYRGVLSENDYLVKVLPKTAGFKDCEITSTYIGKWSWDMALYMSYANIRVFRAGALEGEATYDSTHGSGNMGKFIDAEPKIRELVSQLYLFENKEQQRMTKVKSDLIKAKRQECIDTLGVKPCDGRNYEAEVDKELAESMAKNSNEEKGSSSEVSSPQIDTAISTSIVKPNEDPNASVVYRTKCTKCGNTVSYQAKYAGELTTCMQCDHQFNLP